MGLHFVAQFYYLHHSNTFSKMVVWCEKQLFPTETPIFEEVTSIFCLHFNSFLWVTARDMDEEAPSGNDNIVTEFATYEDFLDSQITQLDLYYLEVTVEIISERLIRKSIVEMTTNHNWFCEAVKSWKAIVKLFMQIRMAIAKMNYLLVITLSIQ